MASTTVALRQASRVGIQYKLLIAAYVFAVILFNSEQGLLLAIPKILAPLIGLAFIVLVIWQGRKIYVPATYQIWAVWFLIAITSTLLADDVRLVRIITLVQLAGIGFFITHFLIWNRDTRFYILTLIGGVAISSVWAMSDPALSDPAGGRIHGTIGNPNSHGVLLSVGLMFSLVVALTLKRWLAKILFLLLASWFFLQLLQTGSRQAMIGGIILGGVTVGGAYLYRNWFAGDGSFARALLAVSMAAPVAATALISSEFWSRMVDAQGALKDGEAADGSTLTRLWFIRRGLEIWADHPILGIGLDNFRHSPEADHFFASAIGTYSHNNYVELLVATGLVGFLLYMSIYFLWVFKLFALRTALRNEKFFGPFVLVLYAVFLVIVTDFARVSHYSKLFWILTPWIVAELHLLESKKNEFFSRGSNK